MWAERFESYAADPRRAWPASRERQAAKLERGLARIASDPHRAVRRVTEEATRRQLDGPPALFVVNCGSSGSHWLTTMLADLPGIADCGEVYLPASLLGDVQLWDDGTDRCAFLDCVHLAHHPTGVLSQAEVLINSAHGSGWRLAQTYGPAASVVLLIRDPYDIVLSRTLRKQEYRDEVAPGRDDDAYLEQNIRFVTRFFERAARAEPDLIISYEDMRRDAVSVLTAVCRAAGIPATPAQCQGAAETHRAGSPTTNIFRGPKVEPPEELKELAAAKLEGVRRRWGYNP